MGLGLDWLVPIGLLETALRRTARVSLAVVIGALAIWSAARGIREFRRMKTPLDPRKPVATLATAGIFASTRNPLYQSQGLFLLALAVGLASDWTMLLIIPWAVAMHVGCRQGDRRGRCNDTCIVGSHLRHHTIFIPSGGRGSPVVW